MKILKDGLCVEERPANATRVLFVCMGNICRSPLAEAIVRQRALSRRLNRQFHFASAGTGDWHVGGGADIRSSAVAKTHDADLSAHRARQITPSGIAHWHWFVAMDMDNKKDLLAMGVNEERVLMMRQFELENHTITPDVPDPYYGGDDGFEKMYQLLAANADPLLDYLTR